MLRQNAIPTTSSIIGGSVRQFFAYLESMPNPTRNWLSSFWSEINLSRTYPMESDAKWSNDVLSSEYRIVGYS